MGSFVSAVKSYLKKVVMRIRMPLEIFRHPSGPPAKTWSNAQAYEFNAAEKFMETEYFHVLMARNKKLRNEKAYELNMEVFFSEFFENDQSKLNSFIDQMNGKCSLEIGPSCATLLGSWWFSKKNYVVEPLFEKIYNYQIDKFGYSIFENTENFSVPAERNIPELIKAIDGAVICRNCIDHSPHWMFILNNIAAYMMPGSYLLIWNDIFHIDGCDEGHYDITEDVDSFRRLIVNLGFQIKREFSYDLTQRNTVNFGVLARKCAIGLC